MARRGTKRSAVTSTGVASLKIAADQAKYTGFEPEWVGVELDEETRRKTMIETFNWYNYHFSSKEAPTFIQEYLLLNGRKDEQKLFKKSTIKLPNAVAWLCRMSLVGWKLNEEEQASIDHAISLAVESQPSKVEEVEEEKPKAKKPNIQEIMRERADECGGEIEGMLDDYIKDGCKATHKHSPISTLKIANILPQHVPPMIEHWVKVSAEFKEAHAGTDKELTNEGYGHFTKIQLRNLVKFCDLVVADLNSYVSFKKANKTPRKKKQKTPQQLVTKLKYMRTFKDDKVDLVSVPPTKIIESKEMFVYSTKKRKLQYYIADEHAGNMLTVKNNTIVGFDTVKSTQKTIRKPEEQLKEFMKASKPNSRKFFKDIKAVETKMSGRFADDIVILKVW